MVQISDLNANQREAVLDDSKYLRIGSLTPKNN